MCKQLPLLLWFPPAWLACWAAGAAIASVPPAARMLLSAMPSSYRHRHSPTQTDGGSLSRMRGEMLRQRPDAPRNHFSANKD